MATSRFSWLSLSGLSSALSNLFYGSTPPATLSNDPVLPENSMERLKKELLDYVENFAAHKRKLGDIREQVLLIQEDIDREQKSEVGGPGLNSTLSLKTSVKGLKGVIQKIQDQDNPLIDNLLEDISVAKDTPSVIKLCDDAIHLISKLEVAIIDVKAFLQDQRDKNSARHDLVSLLLKLAKIPNIFPASMNERNDDKLFVATQPDMDEFFKWLSRAKADLVRAEKEAEKFLKIQQEYLDNHHQHQKIEHAQMTQGLSSSLKSARHADLPTDFGDLKVSTDEKNWVEAGVVIASPKSPESRPGLFNHTSLPRKTSDSQSELNFIARPFY